MTTPTRWGIAALLVLAGPPAWAQDGGPQGPRRDVVACDTLVNLRVMMGTAGGELAGHPGCRIVDRDRVGAAEHRAMVGGAPFECLTVKDEAACLWVRP